jgi:hypothetical protein
VRGNVLRQRVHMTIGGIVNDRSNTSNNGAERLWTGRQASEHLGISPRHLWTITERGDLPCIRVGRCVRYALADIEAYVNRGRSDRKEA